MIEIFKTNVRSPAQATDVIDLLIQHFPTAEINFDLDDFDNILRVKGEEFFPSAFM
ncbi:hypothetical protein SAMN05421821_101394 [Mucilaginibacter lappiensis]|uniref:Uncharacterized protein n=1 Tax=Mucilaginibacter lappiensis TaxID=354630 RepID=A0ABR6PD53_9SPHI|nr:hypothetical protein [Mucilaginibacter lappiensis]MBB6107689.1 hypothetical protein [Mucilaginibacter lappiensis]SIQ00316.1 hypothetical protein SAMN05421821_101394 [Mucilaginibacter lappiensis]